MLPTRVRRGTSHVRTVKPIVPLRRRAQQISLYVLVIFLCFYSLRFAYYKCDTRTEMAILLTKTTHILKENNIEYWLDKGTLLGVHRDSGLIPWEYDVDLGVRNATCDQISALKPQFEAIGLTAYDRSDYIAHKSKITYDTENHNFYWSDPYLHDPCIRIYNTADVATWVDIYWYIELSVEDIKQRGNENVLIPPEYTWKENLLCCSEGLKEYSEHMCCGGCVPHSSVFPLQFQHVSVSDGIGLLQQQYVPHDIPKFLSIQYGAASLSSPEIKGWKLFVCGFWTHPLLFILHLIALSGAVGLVGYLCIRRHRLAKRNKRLL